MSLVIDPSIGRRLREPRSRHLPGELLGSGGGRLRRGAAGEPGQVDRDERRLVQPAVHPEPDHHGGQRPEQHGRPPVAVPGLEQHGGPLHPDAPDEAARRLAGRLTQPSEHRSGGREQPVLTRGGGQLGERGVHAGGVGVGRGLGPVVEPVRDVGRFRRGRRGPRAGGRGVGQGGISGRTHPADCVPHHLGAQRSTLRRRAAAEMTSGVRSTVVDRTPDG